MILFHIISLMFNKILRKEEFYQKLQEAEYPSEEIDSLWGDLMEVFYANVLVRGSQALSPEQLEEAVGKDDFEADEVQQMLENLSKYLQEHVDDIDMAKVFKEAGEEAHKVIAQKLIGEEAK